VVTRGEKGCVIYDVKEQKSRIANEEADVISDAVKKGVYYTTLIFKLLRTGKKM
jgi:hypothetical protein